LAKDTVKKGLTLAFMKIPYNYTKTIQTSIISIGDDDPLPKHFIYIEIDMSSKLESI